MGSQRNEWTTEWPTEPGWYWMAGPDGWLEAVEFGPDAGCSTVMTCAVVHPDEVDGPVVFCLIEPPDLDGARQALRGGV